MSGNGVLLSDILKNIYCWSSYVFGVYCRVNIHFLNIFKKLGFYCRWSSSVFGVLRSASLGSCFEVLSELSFVGRNSTCRTYNHKEQLCLKIYLISNLLHVEFLVTINSGKVVLVQQNKSATGVWGSDLLIVY